MSTILNDFSVYLHTIQQTINQQLDALLPQSTPHNRLFTAQRYSVLNQGKRLRPALVYAIGEVLNSRQERLHGAALSVELIHCYSLIHDDLPAMDDDDLRRGLPTCHVAFDEATAILAGDSLQALAFEVLTDPRLNPVNFATQVAMIRALAQAAGGKGMVLGQAQDLSANGQNFDLNQLTLMHARKTGAIFLACIEMSVLAAESQVEPPIRDALLTYGKHLGLAFQIHDDILDEIGDAALIGKPPGSDQKHAKSTFTQLLGIEGAKAQAARNLNLAIDALQTIPLNTDILIELAKYLISRTY